MGQQKEVVTRKDRSSGTQTAQPHMEGSISLALSPSLQGWQREGVPLLCVSFRSAPQSPKHDGEEDSEPAGQRDVKKKKRCPAPQPTRVPFLTNCLSFTTVFSGLSRWLKKKPACWWRRHKRSRFGPWVRKIPWRRAWQPTPVPVFLPGESPRTEEPGGLQSTGSQESDTTEVLQHACSFQLAPSSNIPMATLLQTLDRL